MSDKTINNPLDALQLANAVETWAFGEGIELSPSLKKKIAAIRKNERDKRATNK